MAIVTKPLVLDETVKEFNRELIEILDNITLAKAKAAEAAASADMAMEKASEATESADLAAAAATEAKGYRDNASKIVTPDGLSAKVNENTDEIKMLKKHNIINMLAYPTATRTYNGVTYTWNGEYCKVVRSGSGTSFAAIMDNETSLMGFEKNKNYYVKFAAQNVRFSVYYYDVGGAIHLASASYGDFNFTLPAEAVGISLRLNVPSDTTPNETVHPVVLNKLDTNINRTFSHNIAMFGDSIMWGRDGNGTSSTQVENTIPKIVAKNLGVNCTNFGVGGMGFLRQAESTGQIAYQKIAAVPLAQYDTIVLCFGVNDGFNPIGEWNSTNESTCLGQFNKIVNYIYAQNPTVRLIVVAPYNGKNVGAAPNYWYGNVGGSAYSRRDLSNALKQACEYYWIPYIEQYDGVLNAFTIENALPDGVHPTQYYYERIGDWLSGEIRRLIG